MRILAKGTMPDKTRIQIEDWSEDIPSLHAKNDVVAAYPIAKQSATRSEYVGISGMPSVWEYPQRYRTFRLALRFPSSVDAETAYNNLLNGNAVLLDYADYMEEKKYAKCLQY